MKPKFYPTPSVRVRPELCEGGGVFRDQIPGGGRSDLSMSGERIPGHQPRPICPASGMSNIASGGMCQALLLRGVQPRGLAGSDLELCREGISPRYRSGGPITADPRRRERERERGGSSFLPPSLPSGCREDREIGPSIRSQESPEGRGAFRKSNLGHPFPKQGTAYKMCAPDTLGGERGRGGGICLLSLPPPPYLSLSPSSKGDNRGGSYFSARGEIL